jgi:hypothetical protein
LPSRGGPPPPAGPPGDPGRSHVPACPRGRPAPLSAPGGVLTTRLVVSRTAACRSRHTGGCPALPPGGLACGPRLSRCRGSMTPPTCACQPAAYAHGWGCTWSALLTGWLGVGPVGCAPCGAPPLGNNNPFHRIAPNSQVSGLPWHEQCLVRRSVVVLLTARFPHLP